MMNKKNITLISILIPLIILGLFSVKIDGFNLSFLPHVYAPLNLLTALILPIAVYQIKKGNRKIHELLMKTALILSVLFLLMYISYHATTVETKYGGVGWMRIIYFVVLISHILLSIIVVPMVLHTYYRAATEQFPAHKKLGKITFLLWEYVAISGVLVYLMIKPFY